MLLSSRRNLSATAPFANSRNKMSSALVIRALWTSSIEGLSLLMSAWGPVTLLFTILALCYDVYHIGYARRPTKPYISAAHAPDLGLDEQDGTKSKDPNEPMLSNCCMCQSFQQGYCSALSNRNGASCVCQRRETTTFRASQSRELRLYGVRLDGRHENPPAASAGHEPDRSV